jgi:hypothetical protein
MTALAGRFLFVLSSEFFQQFGTEMKKEKKVLKPKSGKVESLKLEKIVRPDISNSFLPCPKQTFLFIMEDKGEGA